jgi:hypothetical protein
MNPVKITININVSPEGVQVTEDRTAAVLVNESQAPAPAELDQPEAALEVEMYETMASVPTDEEAGLVLDVSMTAATELPRQEGAIDVTVEETEAPPPSPLEDLDDLSDAA